VKCMCLILWGNESTVTTPKKKRANKETSEAF
jgi:hypothetical protein